MRYSDVAQLGGRIANTLRLGRLTRASTGRLVLLTAILLVALLVTSCNQVQNGALTVVATPCPAVTPVPIAVNPPNHMIFALVDRSSSYERFTKPALDRLAEVLPKVVTAGDRVIVAWIGSNSGDPAQTFFPNDFVNPEDGRVRPVALPAYPPAPTAPSSAGSRTSIQDLQLREALKKYNCDQAGWNQEAQQLTKSWQDDREKATQEFLQKAVPAIKGADVTIDNEGTLIYEAVYEASQVFASSVDGFDYQKRKLLIFSDLQEYRASPPDVIPLQLNKVDVIVAMQYCETPAGCEQAKSYWTPVFKTAGANSVTFLPVNGTTVDTLASLLR